MSLAAAARAGVMAAAPGLPEIGERSPEAGAGLAASEVASSALRSLAVLAGQVSAGRAEGGPGAGSAVGSLLPCSRSCRAHPFGPASLLFPLRGTLRGWLKV